MEQDHDRPRALSVYARSIEVLPRKQVASQIHARPCHSISRAATRDQSVGLGDAKVIL